MMLGMSVPATSAKDLIDQLGVGAADVANAARELELEMASAVDTVINERADQVDVIPVVEFADVLAATVPDGLRRKIAASGCVVVRRTFDPEQASAWDAELGDYLERNRFVERYLGKYPGAATGSGIWPIYWSRPQVEARQHADMAVVRRFLNGFWRHSSGGVDWFDPEHDIAYADRVRRRRPGAEAAGLAMHSDAPSVAGWRIPENQRVFAPLLTHGLERYEPWDAAHRTSVDPRSSEISSVFRTFQGWTALSPMQPDDGVLHLVPIPAAVGYRLVRNLAGELGLDGDRDAAPARDKGDELLARALVPIPPIEPGDTVWWHGDLFHSVGPAANRERWGNVMYIGVAPVCPRNEAYRPSMYPRFVDGVSPVDFPDDTFERDFAGRATSADLNALGRQQFGLPAQGEPLRA